MSEDDLSPSNGSVRPPHLTFSFQACFFSTPESVIFRTYFISNVALLLPLCSLVLCQGLRKRPQRRSSSSGRSDGFIVHVVGIELIGVSGCVLIFWGISRLHANSLLAGLHLWLFSWYGQVFCHILTSVKHYLAVVHPVTYLSLRSERGLRIQHVCVGGVWLLCIGGAVLAQEDSVSLISYLCLLGFSLTFISFCSVAVLRVLTRAGPGGRVRVDRSKRRAFHVIVSILGLLSVKSLCSQILITLFMLSVEKCVCVAFGVWLSLPSSLLLPLMHLHKARKS